MCYSLEAMSKDFVKSVFLSTEGADPKHSNSVLLYENLAQERDSEDSDDNKGKKRKSI